MRKDILATFPIRSQNGIQWQYFRQYSGTDRRTLPSIRALVPSSQVDRVKTWIKSFEEPLEKAYSSSSSFSRSSSSNDGASLSRHSTSPIRCVLCPINEVGIRFRSTNDSRGNLDFQTHQCLPRYNTFLEGGEVTGFLSTNSRLFHGNEHC